MTQAEFELMGKGASQCDKIALVLLARRGEWVSMIDLWKASGAMAVHSRISDLRMKRGMVIDHYNDPQPDRTQHSFYRLTPGVAQTSESAVARICNPPGAGPGADPGAGPAGSTAIRQTGSLRYAGEPTGADIAQAGQRDEEISGDLAAYLAGEER